MQTDSVELSFLSIFAFITFFIFLIVSNYSYKLNNGILLDKDFLKPQAFQNLQRMKLSLFFCREIFQESFFSLGNW